MRSRVATAMVACVLVVSCGATTGPANTGSDAGTAAGGAVSNGGNGGSGVAGNGGSGVSGSGGSGVSGSGGSTSSSGGSLGAGGSSSGGVAASGGSSSGGVAASGGATGTGGSASTMSPLAACRAYLAAACQRLAECGQNEALCLAEQDKCPDLYFSPGSNRQPAELVACGATWATFDCGSALGGAAPPCVIAGSRTTNQSCVFSEQCQSLECSENNGTTCGKCLPAVADGATCDNNATVTCPPDEECMTTCVKPPSMAAPPPPTPPGQPGAVCTSACVTGYACTGGMCVTAPAIGQACTSACAVGAACEAGTCEAYAQAGASCLNPIQCTPGAVCVTDTTTGNPTCKTTRQVGEKCMLPNDQCVPGSGCDQSGTCVALATQGFFAAACGSN